MTATADERGCCAHCADDCRTWDVPPGAWVYEHFNEGATATWDEGCCTACAAETKIATWLRTWPHASPQSLGDAVRFIVSIDELADAIERGDHRKYGDA